MKSNFCRLQRSTNLFSVFYTFCLASGIACAFTVLPSAQSFYKLLSNASTKGAFLPVLWLFVGVIIVYLYRLFKLRNESNAKRIYLEVFVWAFIPRIACTLLLPEYIPTSDFKNYLLYGQYMVQGQYSKVADIVSQYRMPKMGGLAVINGFLSTLFSASVDGYQMANCVITALIAVFIYKLAVPVGKGCALGAALLYAVYPGNIISTQVTSNYHAATLAALAAVYAWNKAMSYSAAPKSMKAAIGAGCLFVLSNFIHPSVIIFVLAVVLHGFLRCFCEEGGCKQKIKLWFCNTGIVFLCLLLLTPTTLKVLQAKGIIHNTEETTILFKIVIGLNQETEGRYAAEDSRIIRSFPKEEQSAKAMEIIKSRVSNPKEVLSLLVKKFDYTWFAEDGYFWWYRAGQTAQLQEHLKEYPNDQYAKHQLDKLSKICSAASNVDVLFLHGCYFLAVIGLICKLCRKKFTELDLFVIIMLGWMTIYLFIEVQSRYRYSAMPALMVIAAYGASCGFTQIRRLINKNKGR